MRRTPALHGISICETCLTTTWPARQLTSHLSLSPTNFQPSFSIHTHICLCLCCLPQHCMHMRQGIVVFSHLTPHYFLGISLNGLGHGRMCFPTHPKENPCMLGQGRCRHSLYELSFAGHYTEPAPPGNRHRKKKNRAQRHLGGRQEEAGDLCTPSTSCTPPSQPVTLPPCPSVPTTQQLPSFPLLCMCLQPLITGLGILCDMAVWPASLWPHPLTLPIAQQHPHVPTFGGVPTHYILFTWVGLKDFLHSV